MTPWLDIPLADYEAHMALPSVGQSQLLAQVLEDLLGQSSPRSVAIIGCAGGNGFERLCGFTGRIVGVDINAQYLEKARERYQAALQLLELHCADIQSSERLFEPVDLIYAALVFEYVDVRATLQTLRRHLNPTGSLATLIQLPHRSLAPVSTSAYTSLKTLEPVMRLVTADELVHEATQVGFQLETARALTLPTGKQFVLHLFHCQPARSLSR